MIMRIMTGAPTIRAFNRAEDFITENEVSFMMLVMMMSVMMIMTSFMMMIIMMILTIFMMMMLIMMLIMVKMMTMFININDDK